MTVKFNWAGIISLCMTIITKFMIMIVEWNITITFHFYLSSRESLPLSFCFIQLWHLLTNDLHPMENVYTHSVNIFFFSFLFWSYTEITMRILFEKFSIWLQLSCCDRTTRAHRTKFRDHNRNATVKLQRNISRIKKKKNFFSWIQWA